MPTDNIQMPDWLSEQVVPDELRRIIDALYRVHKLIAAITDLDTLLEKVMEESRAVTHAEACSLMLFDSATQELFFHVALGERGDQQALKREIRLKLNQGIAGIAAATGETITVADAATDERVYREADAAINFETRNLLAVPLRDRDTLIGVVELVNKLGGNVFTETDVHVMEMFAGVAAKAIANAHLIEENVQSERMAAIGQAVAGLSHYTKNIVTGMNGCMELVNQGLDNKDYDLVHRTWPILQRSANRISLCMEDMMAFSKERQPMRELCTVEELFNDVRLTFSALLANKNIDMQMAIEDNATELYADSRGIYRSLLNLLSNAADAVSPEDGRITLIARRTENGSTLLEVADNGPGVPERDAERIFEPFFSTKGSHGTGLGLAVTRKIVTEHGGAITVRPSAEGGALFQIVLPPNGPHTE